VNKNWIANYTGHDRPKGGAVAYMYTSHDAPVEADEYERVNLDREKLMQEAVSLHGEIVGLRYYIAELEKLASPEELQEASKRALSKQFDVTVTYDREIAPTRPEDMPKPKVPPPTPSKPQNSRG